VSHNMKTLQLHAPTLGADVIGLRDEDTGLAIFRGIPFASVTKRWTQSSTHNPLPSPFDATKFGPRCPQPPHESIIPVAIHNPDPGEDEFQCLNLNITIPEETLQRSTSGQVSGLLPVMVWVHGYVLRLNK
jgi:carboxylesterase type B